jgi:multiple sugar transport system permease protein
VVLEPQSLTLWWVAAFLLPNLAGFLVFTAGPVLFSFGSSLTNWTLQGTEPTQFVGLQNYAEMAHDNLFWVYLANTGYFMLGMPVSIAGSLWLAILLNRKLRGSTAFRTLLYLPAFTSGVAIMILWKAMYNPDFGPINSTLNALFHATGIHAETPNWLLSTRNVAGLEVEHLGYNANQLGLGARDALIFMGIWLSVGGGNMLLYLAALGNVPQELTEAAQLDGANKGKVFRFVTWPQLAPTTFFIVVMSFIGGLQGGFEQAKVMTNGGPAGTTTTLAFYIYTKAFEEFRIGYASAVSWGLFAIIFALTLFQWKFGNKETSWI